MVARATRRMGCSASAASRPRSCRHQPSGPRGRACRYRLGGPRHNAAARGTHNDPLHHRNTFQSSLGHAEDPNGGCGVGHRRRGGGAPVGLPNHYDRRSGQGHHYDERQPLPSIGRGGRTSRPRVSHCRWPGTSFAEQEFDPKEAAADPFGVGSITPKEVLAAITNATACRLGDHPSEIESFKAADLVDKVLQHTEGESRQVQDIRKRFVFYLSENHVQTERVNSVFQVNRSWPRARPPSSQSTERPNGRAPQ